ncbi:hypothetical protein Dimus_035188, partial [Dionaea muscipula]
AVVAGFSRGGMRRQWYAQRCKSGVTTSCTVRVLTVAGRWFPGRRHGALMSTKTKIGYVKTLRSA